ncbi:MAG: LAGLIDADG family homing endonuclease [Candidatus Magasanikbacteria bacterium]|nr:LAGLIDADG family homing endonuclease [Candidatus Magasanikbacteria bacterium]
MTCNNVLSADNQQERLQVPHPWYISGFVDGEGSFHIAIYQDLHMKTHLKFIPEFHISQHKASLTVLEQIKEVLHCGNIKVNHRGRETDQTYVLVVRNRNDLLEKVIPFFNTYPLRTTKAQDFCLFASIVTMMYTNVHLTVLGAKKIISLAYAMNANGYRRKTKYADLIRIVESSETKREIPTRSGKL